MAGNGMASRRQKTAESAKAGDYIHGSPPAENGCPGRRNPPIRRSRHNAVLAHVFGDPRCPCGRDRSDFAGHNDAGSPTDAVLARDPLRRRSENSSVRSLLSCPQNCRGMRAAASRPVSRHRRSKFIELAVGPARTPMTRDRAARIAARAQRRVVIVALAHAAAGRRRSRAERRQGGRRMPQARCRGYSVIASCVPAPPPSAAPGCRQLLASAGRLLGAQPILLDRAA
jgi:hypothetical protein